MYYDLSGIERNFVAQKRKNELLRRKKCILALGDEKNLAESV